MKVKRIKNLKLKQKQSKAKQTNKKPLNKQSTNHTFTPWVKPGMGLVHFNAPALAKTQCLSIKNIHSSRAKCGPINMAFQKQLSMSTKAQHRPCLLSADALF